MWSTKKVLEKTRILYHNMMIHRAGGSICVVVVLHLVEWRATQICSQLLSSKITCQQQGFGLCGCRYVLILYWSVNAFNYLYSLGNFVHCDMCLFVPFLPIISDKQHNKTISLGHILNWVNFHFKLQFANEALIVLGLPINDTLYK